MKDYDSNDPETAARLEQHSGFVRIEDVKREIPPPRAATMAELEDIFRAKDEDPRDSGQAK